MWHVLCTKMYLNLATLCVHDACAGEFIFHMRASPEYMFRVREFPYCGIYAMQAKLDGAVTSDCPLNQRPANLEWKTSLLGVS